jgi:3-oxoadipate enol-lactonase
VNKKENITVEINNTEINYSDYGNAEQQTIVFIHGYPMDQTMWEQQVAFLSNRYRLIVYDIRGFGRSKSGIEKYSMSLFADDLSALLKQLGISEVVICGFSMGGYIALNAISRYPELFSGIILHDTQCNADTDEAREQRMQSIDFLRRNGNKGYAGPFIKKLISEVSQDNKKLVSYLEEKINGYGPEQLINILLALAERSETCSKLKEIHVPALIIMGDEDAIISRDKAEFLHLQIKDSQLKFIPGAGHLSNMEKPDLFNSYIKHFMEELE